MFSRAIPARISVVTEMFKVKLFSIARDTNAERELSQGVRLCARARACYAQRHGHVRHPTKADRRGSPDLDGSPPDQPSADRQEARLDSGLSVAPDDWRGGIHHLRSRIAGNGARYC